MRRIVFFSTSPEATRLIELPRVTLICQGRLSTRTDLQDSHVYIVDASQYLRNNAHALQGSIGRVGGSIS